VLTFPPSLADLLLPGEAEWIKSSSLSLDWMLESPGKYSGLKQPTESSGSESLGEEH
jgi:hypothetical protein